jgi:hypothetical protein
MREWDDNIKMNFQEGVDWIYVAHNRGKLRDI